MVIVKPPSRHTHRRIMGKRRRRTSSSSSSDTSSSSSSSYSNTTFQHSDAHILFGVTLAALCNRELQGHLVIQQALDRILLSLLSNSTTSIITITSSSHQTLHVPLVSLLPVLLNSKCSEIACSGLEIVGAASLFSIEMNEQIALDDEIVKRLIAAVVSSRRSVSMAACSAVLDLFTTSVGRCRFLEFSAIDNIMSLNLQHLRFL